MDNLTSGISHIGLTVPDIDKTVSFFEAVRFKKVGGVQSYPSIFLSDGSTMVTVWKANVSSPTPFDRTANVGLHHMAVKVPTRDALNQVYQIVSSIKDVKLEFAPRPVDGTNITHFMCYEPCGVRIEFAYHAA